MPYHHKIKSMTHQNFTTIKIFHISIHNYQIFPQLCEKKKNSYMTKIKIPTNSCTNKFSHSQNHNHTNFPRIKHDISNKIFHESKFHTHKICPSPQIYPCTYPQNFSMSLKQGLHIPINFSYIHHENIQISLTQNFHNANTPKIQTKIHSTT